MRVDAKKNFDQLLSVARSIFTTHGADASLRDIARQAGVGLGTLYRHFPTREALLEALLHESFAALAQRAAALEELLAPDPALLTWLHEAVALTFQLRGITTVMMAAIEDPDSALHSSCVSLRSAGTRLLERAQAGGTARADMDGVDLFALIAALAWLGDQPGLAARSERLFTLFTSAVVMPAADARPSAPVPGHPVANPFDAKKY